MVRLRMRCGGSGLAMLAPTSLEHNVTAHVSENEDGLVPRGIKSKRQAPLRGVARQHYRHIAHIARREVRLYPTRHVIVRPLENSFQDLTNLLVVRWVGALKRFKGSGLVEIDAMSRSGVTRCGDGSPEQCKNRCGN